MSTRNTEPLGLQRKVLTLYGERGWNEADGSYSEGSMDRGFSSMNTVVNKVAKQVVVHSVSYSHIHMTIAGKIQMMLVSATILYSGNLDILKTFGSIDVLGNPRRGDEVVIRVQL